MRKTKLSMVKQSPKPGREILQELPAEAPAGWADVQQRLADASGLSMLLVNGHQPPALAVSNNNSICQALQSSPAHAHLCDPYCGDAHRRAKSANDVTQYRCHAGLHCFAMPVQIGKNRDLAVIGGRAFLAGQDYRETVERFRVGDLKDLGSKDPFAKVIFGAPGDLEELANRLVRATRDFSAAPAGLATAPPEPIAEPLQQSETSESLSQEVQRLRGELEYQSRFAESLQGFLERISSTDAEKTYLAILTNSKELLRAERASLLVFNEATNELTVKAAVGLAAEVSEVSPMHLGEGISGTALQSGLPMIVADLEAAGITPAPAERRYKTKSFISYPIMIGGRRIGILNVADKSGGGPYDQVDASLLEIVAPQVALALERAEWQEKANQYQLMSITDPLTALPNRRYLEERLTEEVNRSKRYEHPMSFLMIDIDDFKVYNDRNGHQAGDVALQITAHALKGALRSADVASRYGGEEFCILLPQTSLTEAGVIAERIRERIEHTTYPHAKRQPLGAVTISIGVAAFSPFVNTAEQIIWAADRALYDAKNQGKNKIAFYQDAFLRVAKADERGSPE
jgi:diguanylate cyclase (GGDEF)-like protein